MAQILLLEDETPLREELASFLTGRGHRVLEAGTLQAFRPLIPHAEVSIVDVMLPDGSGFEAMTEVRRYSPRAGIVMLSARGATEDKLQALQGGADHYLVKPVPLAELAAVIDALLRRVGSGWQLDQVRRELRAPGGFTLRLSPQEMVLLRELALAPGRVVSRPALVQALGHDWLSFDERRINTFVSRLRRRWQTASGRELPLRTEHREGYSFSGAISLV